MSTPRVALSATCLHLHMVIIHFLLSSIVTMIDSEMKKSHK
jgi:hypothetical protein